MFPWSNFEPNRPATTPTFLKMTMKNLLLLPGVIAFGLATFLSPAAYAAGETAAATKAEQLFGDPVIARAKDFEIKRSQLDEAFINAKTAAAGAGVTIKESERELLELRLLNDLIVSRLLSAKATEADRQAAREAAEKFIAEARKQFPSEEAFVTKLKASKMTVDELRQKLVTETLPNTILEREMKAQISITDDQAKKFYEENPAKFEESESVKAAHILKNSRNPVTGAAISDEQKAENLKQLEALLKRAKAGEDFEKLAAQFSDSITAREDGGVVRFARGTPGVPPAFETAAFALKPGEVSPVVTTEVGFHLIKLLEKIPARTVPLAEASSKIKDYLFQREATKMAPAYFVQLKNDASLEILDERLKTAQQNLLRYADDRPDTSPLKP